MSVIRADLNKCIGCRNCAEICPMDVFYFDEAAHKSVIAYPENCQSCGQCYVNCKGRALDMTNETFGYSIMPVRGVTTAPLNHYVVTEKGAIERLTKGKLP